MDIMTTAAELNKARAELFRATEEDAEAARELEDARNQAIVDGLIVGKNAEEREAKAAQVLAEQIGKHRVTAAQVRYARFLYDQASTDFEAVKYMVRLTEAQA